MEIGGAKSEVAHRTELQGHSQAVGVTLIGVNEGPIMLGQGEIQHLVSYRVQQHRVVKRSSGHENLQNLLTRTAISEEPLSDLQQRMEDFTSYHTTALTQSNLTLSKRELLH